MCSKEREHAPPAGTGASKLEPRETAGRLGLNTPTA